MIDHPLLIFNKDINGVDKNEDSFLTSFAFDQRTTNNNYYVSQFQRIKLLLRYHKFFKFLSFL